MPFVVSQSPWILFLFFAFQFGGFYYFLKLKDSFLDCVWPNKLSTVFISVTAFLMSSISFWSFLWISLSLLISSISAYMLLYALKQHINITLFPSQVIQTSLLCLVLIPIIPSNCGVVFLLSVCLVFRDSWT